jgi:hypothetical protein
LIDGRTHPAAAEPPRQWEAPPKRASHCPRAGYHGLGSAGFGLGLERAPLRGFARYLLLPS